MLLILMYHRVHDPYLAGSEELFGRHLKMIQQRFKVVLPGDRLSSTRLSVCLTFDDAYYDFYHTVFPLLKALNLRAVLGVPTGFILEITEATSMQRLSAQRAATTVDAYPDYRQRAPFCTWPELRIMAQSGQVMMASHSHHHVDLTLAESDFEKEVVQSKQILEQQLSCEVETLIYPYGRMNRDLNQRVRQHYRYAMRIGSALNWGWQNPTSVLYRIDADQFWPAGRVWKAEDTVRGIGKAVVNTVRGK